MPRVSPDLVYIKRNVISSARGGTQEFVKVDEFLRGMEQVEGNDPCLGFISFYSFISFTIYNIGISRGTI